jgi:prophage tail gpP-like protein
VSEVKIEIEGVIIEGFEATSIQRNLDSIADGFTFSGAYDPDSIFAYLLEPPQKVVKLYIDDKLYITALSEKWKPGFEQNSTITSIECRTRAGALVDCTTTDSVCTYKDMTLSAIASQVCNPFGISALFQDGDSPPIKLAQRCPTDTVFSFLKKLACNYEFIITSTPEGNIKFTKPSPDASGAPVDSLQQGVEPLISVDCDIDYTKAYSEYTATGQFPGVPDAIATTVDTTMTQFRPIMFKADAKDQGSLQLAAEWRKTRALVSGEVTVVVDGWRNRKGDLWQENTIITLVAPNAYLFNPFNYLIKNVTLDKTESAGETATLTLVMPESFTGVFPAKSPWLR